MLPDGEMLLSCRVKPATEQAKYYCKYFAITDQKKPLRTPGAQPGQAELVPHNLKTRQTRGPFLYAFDPAPGNIPHFPAVSTDHVVMVGSIPIRQFKTPHAVRRLHLHGESPARQHFGRSINGSQIHPLRADLGINVFGCNGQPAFLQDGQHRLPHARPALSVLRQGRPQIDCYFSHGIIIANDFQ
jgi:hypothetical protein